VEPDGEPAEPDAGAADTDGAVEAAPNSADGAKAAPKPRRKPLSMAAALGYAVSSGDMNEHSTTERLHSLARGHGVYLHRQVPALADRLIASRRIPDWPGLLIDLARWDQHRPQIATSWLRSYHRALLSSDDPDPDPPSAPTPEEEESDPT